MKNMIIFILSLIVVTLLYFIMIGKFCHCSTIYCPKTQDTLKGYMS